MKKFKRGDTVIITSGKDKGKKGEIIRILPSQDKVVVKGLNLYKKHLKPRENKPGGVVEIERPLPTAKIMLLDGGGGGTGKPTRVGLTRNKAGVYRVSKKTGKKL